MRAFSWLAGHRAIKKQSCLCKPCRCSEYFFLWIHCQTSANRYVKQSIPFWVHRKKSLANRQTAGWQKRLQAEPAYESPHDETLLRSARTPPECCAASLGSTITSNENQSQ
jgi:hypothetical protein